MFSTLLSSVRSLLFVVVGCVLPSEGLGQDYEALFTTAQGHGFFTYGVYAYVRGEKDQAAASFETALKHNGQLAIAHLFAGDLQFEAGRFAEARVRYRACIAIDPDEMFAHYNLACASARDGDSVEALKEVEATLRLGYNRYDKMLQDSDLAALRDLPEFGALVEKFRVEPVALGPRGEFLLADFAGKTAILQRVLEAGSLDWRLLAERTLLDSSERIRVMGIALHRVHGGQESLSVLVRGLFDSNGYVNKAAGNALVAIGQPALPYMDALLASTHEGAKFYAQQIKRAIEAANAAPATADH